MEAARERLRPILMTSFAFILGVFPLVIAEGAGAEMRRTLGMAVFAGMIGVTLFGLFLTPVFYYVVRGLVRGRTPVREPADRRGRRAVPGTRGGKPVPPRPQTGNTESGRAVSNDRRRAAAEPTRF